METLNNVIDFDTFLAENSSDPEGELITALDGALQEVFTKSREAGLPEIVLVCGFLSVLAKQYTAAKREHGELNLFRNEFCDILRSFLETNYAVSTFHTLDEG